MKLLLLLYKLYDRVKFACWSIPHGFKVEVDLAFNTWKWMMQCEDESRVKDHYIPFFYGWLNGLREEGTDY